MADGQAVVAVDAAHGAHTAFTTLISTLTQAIVKRWAYLLLPLPLHKIFATSLPSVNFALGGPAGWLLILLSIAVLTATFERIRFWLIWWQRRKSRQHQWQELVRLGGSNPHDWMEERDLDMRFGQSFLEAATLIAPLLGLIGTVLGLSRLLSSMGPQLVLPPGGKLSGFGDVLLSTAMGLVVSLLALVTLYLNNTLRQWQQTSWRRDLQRHAPSP